jgi:hypothetical protein
VLFKIFKIFWLPFIAFSISTQLSATPDYITNNLWILSGPCSSPSELGTIEDLPTLAVCLRGSMSAGTHIHSKFKQGNATSTFGEVYFSAQFLRRLSLFLKFNSNRVLSIIRAKPDDSLIHTTETLMAQFGNSIFDHFRLNIGKMKLPYGVDMQILPEYYLKQIKTQRFWMESSYGSRLVYDNLVDTTFELGAFSEANPLKERELSRATLDELTLITTRMNHDISALGGTRLSVFFSRVTDSDTKQYGAAIQNHNADGSVTGIEFQRLIGVNVISDGPFDQLFRISHKGTVRKSTRTLFEYEEDNRQYWWLAGGQKVEINEFQEFNFILGYKHSRVTPEFSFVSIYGDVKVHL